VARGILIDASRGDRLIALLSFAESLSDALAKGRRSIGVIGLRQTHNLWICSWPLRSNCDG
jgi:hypothetical protein